jgi:nucleoside-diphosphate-sugar epimerase
VSTAVVTGATGFLGWALTRALAGQGWDVHAVVRSSSDRDRLPLGVTAHVDDGTTEGLVAALAPVEADVCFHLASYFVGRHAPADVVPLVEANVAFTARLAEAVAGPRAPLMVNAGTAWQHVEGAAYRPAALYAATKQAGVDILRFHADAGLLRVVSLALYDTYGPGDPRPKLLNQLRTAQRCGEPLAMSPGEQLIDLVYVDDVAEAVLAAADAGEQSVSFAEFAVASGAPVSLRELVAMVEEVTGRPVPVRWGALSYRSNEMLTYWDVAPVLPGWKPQVGLEEGIRRTFCEEESTPGRRFLLTEPGGISEEGD